MTARSPVRVIIAGGDGLFRYGVRALLADSPDIELAADVGDGNRVPDLVATHRPQVLLLDSGIRGLHALEILTRLASLDRPPHTILLVDRVDRTLLRRALLRGARGMLRKDQTAPLLRRCIQQVGKGELWIGREDVEDLVNALRTPAPGQSAPPLSDRERDIIDAVRRGATNKEIAAELGLGEQTVKNYLRRIFEKLNVANRVELALHADDRSNRGEQPARRKDA